MSDVIVIFGDIITKYIVKNVLVAPNIKHLKSFSATFALPDSVIILHVNIPS